VGEGIDARKEEGTFFERKSICFTPPTKTKQIAFR